jgi:anti-anti-sigma factor
VTAMTSRERSERPRTDGSFPALRSVPPVGPAILSLRDGLDLPAASALRERLLEVLRHGPDLLILDLSDTPSCDVAGLAVLIGTQRRARLLGMPVRLVAPSLVVRRVLRSTGLDRSFTICPDLSGALAAEPREPARPASAPPVLAAASSC